jgi:hypothetical protein
VNPSRNSKQPEGTLPPRFAVDAYRWSRAAPRVAILHISAHCSLTPCESRFINEGRLASHDETRNKEDELMNRLEECVGRAESDLKLLGEILGRILTGFVGEG